MRCEEKRSYSKKEAATVVNRLNHHRRRHRHGRPHRVRSYQCNECDRWHLTHR